MRRLLRVFTSWWQPASDKKRRKIDAKKSISLPKNLILNDLLEWQIKLRNTF